MLAWGRQEDESARAFEAFELYRDMGPERSLAKVGRQLGKSVGLMERWSAAHDWVDRVKALEARDAMLMREAVEEHLANRADDHARRETALRERALEIREKAAEKALRVVSSPLYRQERVVEGPDGEDVTLVMMPAGWTQATAIGLFNLSQNNAGLTADEVEMSGYADFSALSEDEMAQLLELDGKIQVRPPDHGRERR